MLKTLDKNNFLESLNNRSKPKKTKKTISFHGRTIANVPVIETFESFESDSLSSDTITKIYHLIQQYPQEKHLYFK